MDKELQSLLPADKFEIWTHLCELKRVYTRWNENWKRLNGTTGDTFVSTEEVAKHFALSSQMM
jgi:hydroxylamine reductase (hybrid-cluster protein)